MVTSQLDINSYMRRASVIPNSSVSNQVSYDSLRAVISDFRESINQRNHDAQSMTEEEFPQFVNYIRQRIFTNTSPLPHTGNNNSQEILQEILRHSQNQTEFLRRITDILSNLTETKTIIKLSLAFAFVWSMNTFFKNK
jgi:phosphoenolpyruvate carboxylase